MLSVPGFSKPRPPLPSCDCHTACMGTGRSFSLWCETWQKGMATTQLSPPLLLCLIYTSGNWVSEERCWKQMFSIWICRAYQLCVVVRLTCSESCSHLRMPRVLEGVSMLLGWELSEAFCYKDRLFLTASVETWSCSDSWRWHRMHWKSPGMWAVSLQGLQKGRKARDRVSLGVGWITV